MATSQQWRHAGLLLGATLVVLLIGSADAWDHCPSGYKTCNKDNQYGCETCIRTDANNCGDCGNKCKELPYTTVKCNYGRCEHKCMPGWANCDDNMWGNGCEKDVHNDDNHCGWCGNKCKELPYTTAKCNNGRCEHKCMPGWDNCDDNMWGNGCEKDVGNDIFNCGGCRKQCPVTRKGGEATCRNGKCGERCKKGSKYDQGSNECREK